MPIFDAGSPTTDERNPLAAVLFPTPQDRAEALRRGRERLRGGIALAREPEASRKCARRVGKALGSGARATGRATSVEA